MIAFTPTRRWRRLLAASAGLAALSAIAAAPAGATFPGRDGRIAFVDYTTSQIYSVNPDGSARRQLTHTAKNRAADGPAWAPDGKSLLFGIFRTDRADGRDRIWVMRADGTHKHPVGHEAKGFRDLTAHYTPDGRQIVFTRCHPPPKDVCAIWKMRADGTHKRALTPYVHTVKDEHLDFDPSVSPNGKRIAFSRFNAGGFAGRIFVMRADGGDAHAISPARLEAFRPDWSPSGERITFSSAGPRTGSSVYTIKPDGTGLRRITPSRYPHNDALSVYSPAGDRLAFVSDRNYRDACCNDLFTIKPNGRGERRVHARPPGSGIIIPAWGTAPLIR